MDILNLVGGLIVLGVFFALCYYIGQLGVQIKSGLKILKYIKKAEKKKKKKGLSLNEEGIALKKKGKRKLIFPIVGITVFYSFAFSFAPTIGMKLVTLIILIPVVLGFFGIFLVPEALGED